MRYVAAYLLAALGGKGSPSTGDIKKILDSVGIEADDTRMDKVSLQLCMNTKTGSNVVFVRDYIHSPVVYVLLFTFLYCRLCPSSMAKILRR